MNDSRESKTAEPSCKGVKSASDYHVMHEIVERLLASHADCRQTGMGQANPCTGCDTYRNVLVDSAGTVDQLDDRVGVVDEVGGQGLVGEVIAVGCDEGLEVVGDGAGGGVAHAVGGGALRSPAPGRGGCGCSERNSCEGEDGTHVGGGDVRLQG